MPNYLFRLVVILLIKSLAILFVIFYAGIGLSPDEAQYWTWSQRLDVGYYSKPPGIAWQIWLGTSLLGSNEAGVRLFSMLWGISQSLLIYWMALQAGLEKRAAFWSGLLMAFTPLGVAGSFFAITDGGALFFWTAACCSVLSALHKNKEPEPWIIGLCLGFGALFKWPVYFFWIFFFTARSLWFSTLSIQKCLAGVILSLAGLLPSLWWNYQHDFATFRHVSATLQGGHGNVRGNPLEFFGSQFALLSPIIFALLILSFIPLYKRRKELASPLLFCGLVTGLALIAAIGLSFFQKIQGNWAVFAYPTSFILISWFWREEKWLKIGLLTSIVLITLLFALPTVYQYNPSLIPFKRLPFKQNLGGLSIAKILKQVGYDTKQSFLLSDTYQTTSLLSFYGPDQKMAYLINLKGSRHNQFSYWPSFIEEKTGKSAYFVTFDYQTPPLEDYFTHTEYLGKWPVLSEKSASIYKCSGFKDRELPGTALF
jgi:4-amino-4-deoxy-L-arabinose transferase-like glycosyltransferase